MKRRIIIAVLLAVFPLALRAQQVVIDPSQIAASATNAANQIDYMLDQLGELAHLGEQMNTMREHIDNVFGEDGIGGKAISVMQDLGTLARLTESYNSTIKMTEAYARQMQEMERYKLSDANMMLSYLNSMKTQIELAIETAKKILNTMGFSKAEKKEEIEKMLNERDGLMLGICNGFQALIKLGLVPNGTISEQKPDSPTLTYNNIGRHISKMVNLKVVSNKSPWLAGAELGGVYVNPVSHGEGRFVASEEWLQKLFANGQVATQYVDANGNATMDEYWNPNGSYMAIEGITSPDGRIYGKMAHSERRGDAVAKNIYGEQDMKLFESGVKYFR